MSVRRQTKNGDSDHGPLRCPDISLEETSVCIVNGDGKIIRETKVSTDPDALAKELVALKLDLKRVGLEASSLGGWLHAELSRRGFPAIVGEARHMRASLNAQRNKTDRNDARGIAQMMRMGWFRAAWAYETPRSLTRFTASSLNSRLNFRLSIARLQFH
jgi:transposase